jgi:hypothetical protein
MATEFDNSWNALLNPGKATHYFNIDYPQIALDGSVYSPSTALWLAELSRLIYRKDKNKKNQSIIPTRSEILNKVLLQETHFVNQHNTTCAIVECQENIYPAFAVLVFRGTQESQDWLINLNTLPTRWLGGGRVHRGFKQAWENVWSTVEPYLSTLKVPIFYTGHSLGAALATLAAAKRPPQALYTFGTPRVGDAEFSKIFANIKAYRVVNHRDLVATVPPTALGFCHVGELHYLTHDKQTLVKPDKAVVVADRKTTAFTWQNSINYRRWSEPPECLSDHAPVNYVAHLERQWLAR